MYKVLVACRTGMGSSMMLKIKVEQVIIENGWNMVVEHDEITSANSFTGDLLITMDDLSKEYTNRDYDVIGIVNLMDKEEVYSKINEFLLKKE